MKANLILKILLVGACASVLMMSFAGCSREDMSSTQSKIESTVSDVRSNVNSVVDNSSAMSNQ